MNTKEIGIGKVRIGKGNPITLIAGPCVIESEASTLRHAECLKGISEKLKVPFIYKTSFDKANRTSIKSYSPSFKRYTLDGRDRESIERSRYPTDPGVPIEADGSHYQSRGHR
jgi:hypothetical protein